MIKSIAAFTLLACLMVKTSAHDSSDIATKSPAAFLEMLKTYDNHLHTYIINRHLKGWVTEDDVPELLARLDSKEPCAGVMYEASGSIPGRSTVGDQAAFLIEGFRTRIYPPSLYSKPLTDSQKADLRSWWKIYQTALVAPVRE